jgi:hypothetical protein
MNRIPVAVVLTLSLGGCCASGVGCNAPTAGGGPVAWDGLDALPAENAIEANSMSTASDPPGKPKTVRRIAARPDNQPQPIDQFGREQSSDQAADAKLNNQLKICRNC